MIQKTKITGVALAAAMMLGAVAASSASAAEHHFDGKAGESVTVTVLTPFLFEHTTGSGVNNGCKKVTMEGELGKDTNTSLTLAPTFSECITEKEGKNEGSMTWALNGCHYTFYGFTTKGNPTGGEHANLELLCPEGKSMETLITGLKIKCATIGSQQIQHAVRYESATTEGGKNHVRAIVTAHGIDSTTVSACGGTTHDNGSIATELTMSTPNGISLSTT